MLEAWSLSFNPIDVGAVGLAALLLISLVWLAARPRRGRTTTEKSKLASRQASGAVPTTGSLPSNSRPAAPKRIDLPAETSRWQNLMALFARIEAGLEQTRQAVALESQAIRKLDAIESEFLSLCDEIATVSSFARQRVERPNLGAFAAAAANLGLSAPQSTDDRAATGRPVEPQIDRDPERARRRRRSALSEAA